MKKALPIFIAVLLVFCIIGENFTGNSNWQKSNFLGEGGIYTNFSNYLNAFSDKVLEYGRLLFFGNENSQVSVDDKTYYIPFTNVFLLEDFEDIIVITVGSSTKFNVAGGIGDYVILYSSDSRFIFEEKYSYYYKFLKGMYLKDSNGNEHKVLSSTSISGSDYRCLSDFDYHLFYDYYFSLLQ